MNAYCSQCNENLTLHADGTVACSCAVSMPGCDTDPAWRHADGTTFTLADLEAWREQEREYSATE